MEMEMEVVNEISEMSVLTGRLAAAAEALEQAAGRLAGVQMQASQTRESELEARLADAEATIASLKAGGRKTMAASASLMAKEGVAVEAGALAGLDGALASLSVEQRIAVKAGLMRSGLLG